MRLEFRFPDVGEGIDAGELVEWHVAAGQMVREDEPMADVQTDKATVTIPCPTTGRVLELRMREGDVVPVGAVMAVFEPSGAPVRPLASPAVRRRARELDINLARVHGSGPGGRIDLEDLEKAAGARGAERPAPTVGVEAPAGGAGSAPAGGAGSAPAGGAGNAPAGGAGNAPAENQVVPLRGVRRAIAHTMTEAWRTIPHIIDYREADATELLRRREQLREQAPQENLRRALTITPLLLRVAVSALRGHPYVNASIDMEREQITLHHAYNIGVATAAPDGLVVPVVRHADTKSVSELALEIAELSAAARARRLRPEQLTGGTFTLNNYGTLGAWLGTPIIKPGEVANLGVGRVQERPVAVDGEVVVRPIVALAVSGDHRVLDGHTLGAFVSDLVALIEDPAPLRW